MNKSRKTLVSIMMIGFVAALFGSATYAVFSDTEMSVGNDMVAGTIDFSVDGKNPWTDTTWSDDLNDMKPGVVKETDFDITNVGVNPIYLYKKLDITDQAGGFTSEPECVEGNGVYTDGSCGGDYIERCNLASYTLYDMTIQIYNADGTIDGDLVTLIDVNQYIRLDNVDGVWIKLGEVALEPTQYMTVKQNYVLSSWPDATELTVTNWAQGDILTFDITLYGEQVTGAGPNSVPGEVVTETTKTVVLDNKDAGWEPIVDDRIGSLTYNIAGNEFVYDFTGTGLNEITDYSLIYYSDPFPGTPSTLIASGITDNTGVLSLVGSVDLGMNLPSPPDQNMGVGAKIWLVTTSDYDGVKMVDWNPDAYLFDMSFITYSDTDV